jgi:hypothetical protein
VRGDRHSVAVSYASPRGRVNAVGFKVARLREGPGFVFQNDDLCGSARFTRGCTHAYHAYPLSSARAPGKRITLSYLAEQPSLSPGRPGLMGIGMRCTRAQSRPAIEGAVAAEQINHIGIFCVS